MLSNIKAYHPRFFTFTQNTPALLNGWFEWRFKPNKQIKEEAVSWVWLVVSAGGVERTAL